MEVAFLFAVAIAGAVAANRVAKWRGLNVGGFTAGGLLFSLIAVPVGFLARAHPEKSTGSKSSAMIAVSIWAILLLAIFLAGVRDEAINNHRSTIDRVIKENFADAIVQTDYVSLPFAGFGPFFLSEYSGYFTLKEKDGSAPLPRTCKLITVDFTARATADGYILQVQPTHNYWPTCSS